MEKISILNKDYDNFIKNIHTRRQQISRKLIIENKYPIFQLNYNYYISNSISAEHPTREISSVPILPV